VHISVTMLLGWYHSYLHPPSSFIITEPQKLTFICCTIPWSLRGWVNLGTAVRMCSQCLQVAIVGLSHRMMGSVTSHSAMLPLLTRSLSSALSLHAVRYHINFFVLHASTTYINLPDYVLGEAVDVGGYVSSTGGSSRTCGWHYSSKTKEVSLMYVCCFRPQYSKFIIVVQVYSFNFGCALYC